MARVRIPLAALLLAPSLAAAQAVAPFKHIIVVIQENRTVDNVFGSNPTFEPGLDIATQGTTSTGQVIALAPRPLADCYDMAHSYETFKLARSRGFDLEPYVTNPGCAVPANPPFKYVDNATGTVQPYFDIATANGFANRMFQTNQGPSFPAHQFLFGGTSTPRAASGGFRLYAAEYRKQYSRFRQHTRLHRAYAPPSKGAPDND